MSGKCGAVDGQTEFWKKQLGVLAILCAPFSLQRNLTDACAMLLSSEVIHLEIFPKLSNNALMFWNKRSPNKRYQCSVCPYSSNDSSNMRRHKMVHTQERPYGCMFCSKAFNHKLMYIGVALI